MNCYIEIRIVKNTVYLYSSWHPYPAPIRTLKKRKVINFSHQKSLRMKTFTLEDFWTLGRAINLASIIKLESSFFGEGF